MYVHEVTLHDLNVLHDGADLSGPLRLELRVISPRFISCYHDLRDQIARLDLAAESEDIHRGGLSEVEHERVDHATSSDVLQYPEEEVKEVEHGEGTHETKAAQIGEQEPASQVYEEDESVMSKTVSTAPSSQPHGEADGEQAQQERDHNDDLESSEDAEGDEEGSVDNLDADEVHRYADADEGGDYVEHAQDVEDDEQRFGEDLPDEFGGNADATDDPQNHLSLKGQSPAETRDDEQGDQEYSSVINSADSNDALDLEDHDDADDADDIIKAGEVYTDVLKGESNATDPEEGTSPGIYEVVEEDPDAGDSFAGTRTLSTEIAHSDGLDATTFEDDDWPNSPDFDNAPLPETEPELGSEKASTTSIKSSKRAYDELELDDDDDAYAESRASSPESKRPRVQ